MCVWVCVCVHCWSSLGFFSIGSLVVFLKRSHLWQYCASQPKLSQALVMIPQNCARTIICCFHRILNVCTPLVMHAQSTASSASSKTENMIVVFQESVTKTSWRDSFHRQESTIRHGSSRTPPKRVGDHQCERPGVSSSRTGMKPERICTRGRKSEQPYVGRRCSSVGRTLGQHADVGSTSQCGKGFFSQNQLSVQILYGSCTATCAIAYIDMHTFKIPSTGSHTLVWTHKNTAGTGRSG